MFFFSPKHVFFIENRMVAIQNSFIVILICVSEVSYFDTEHD